MQTKEIETHGALAVAYQMGLATTLEDEPRVLCAILLGECPIAGPPTHFHHEQFLAAFERGLKDRTR